MRRDSRGASTVGRRRVRGLAAMLGALVAVSGCSMQGGATVSAEEARDDLVGVMNDTADLVGGGWEPVGGRPAAGPCEGGTSFGYTIATAPGSDASVDARRVLEYWRELGMEARLVEEPVLTVYARGGRVQSISFATGPTLYDISGTSRCGEGGVEGPDGAAP